MNIQAKILETEKNGKKNAKITSLKSPLRYTGGKSKAIKQISPFFPKNFQEYREPFLGGGSVFLHLKQAFPHKKFWLNDLYTELYFFWKMAQEQNRALLNQIQLWKHEFQEGKILYKFLKENIANFSVLEKAAAFFIFNRVTFSGTSEAGGFSQLAYEKRFTESSLNRLSEIETILQEVIITNMDYETLLTTEGENVFIFLDPPYFSATSSALYGKNGDLHKKFDHERLAKTLKNCPHTWLMTYDDSPYIRNLYDFAHLQTWDLKYGMRNVNENTNKIGKELLISSIQLENVASNSSAGLLFAE